jgi:hypothetical protein
MATLTIPDAMAEDLKAAAKVSGKDPNAFAVAHLGDAIKAALSTERHAPSDSAISPWEEIRVALQPFHIYDDGDEVIEFLAAHPDVIPALKTAQETILAHFGPKVPIYLEVVHDPENHSPSVLIMDILTDMSTPEARDKARPTLTRLRRQWRDTSGTRLLSVNMRDTSVAGSQ